MNNTREGEGEQDTRQCENPNLKYVGSIKERWSDDYFIDRNLNNPLRKIQFEQDASFIRSFIKDGVVCDVGCSTGEFLRHIKFKGILYGMEINDQAKKIASDIISFEKNIFTEENFEWIRNNVKKIVGEWHLVDEEQKSQFKKFRDLYLRHLTRFEVYAINDVDIKDNLWTDEWIDFYGIITLYIDNR